MPKTQLILSCYIAGLPHRNPDLTLLAIGQEVMLIPEVQNQYDPNAIQVFDSNSQLLGYVPREQTCLIHSAIQNGFEPKAYISEMPLTKWKEILIQASISLP